MNKDCDLREKEKRHQFSPLKALFVAQAIGIDTLVDFARTSVPLHKQKQPMKHLKFREIAEHV